MTNFLDIVFTKMVTILDVRNVTMLWRKFGGQTIKTKKELYVLDIEKKIEEKSGNKIKTFMKKTPHKDVFIKNIIYKKIPKFTNVGSNIVKLLRRVYLYVIHHVKSVEKQVKDLMAIIMIIVNPLMSCGFVKVVIFLFIKDNHRERLSEKTLKSEATVRTTKETCGEKTEEFSPPSELLGQYVVKITESNRKQCLNNDMWAANLRSTGI